MNSLYVRRLRCEQWVERATAPAGFLATHSDVGDFDISPIARAVKHHHADVFVWHLRLAPNSALGWHTHRDGQS